LTYADQGTKDELIASLRTAAMFAGQELEVIRAMAADYLDTGGPFPARRHISTLTGAFVAEFLELVQRWTRFAEHEISTWDDTAGVGLTPATSRLLENVVEGRPALASDATTAFTDD
jgi:hypothetical protein